MIYQSLWGFGSIDPWWYWQSNSDLYRRMIKLSQQQHKTAHHCSQYAFFFGNNSKLLGAVSTILLLTAGPPSWAGWDHCLARHDITPQLAPKT